MLALPYDKISHQVSRTWMLTHAMVEWVVKNGKNGQTKFLAHFDHHSEFSLSPYMGQFLSYFHLVWTNLLKKKIKYDYMQLTNTIGDKKIFRNRPNWKLLWKWLQILHFDHFFYHFCLPTNFFSIIYKCRMLSWIFW